MSKKITPIIIAIVAAGAGFLAGIKYDQSKNSTPRFAGQNPQNLSEADQQRMAQQFRGNGMAQTGAMRAGFSGANFISGEIISQDEKSLTVKLRDGGSKIVFYSANTEVMKSATGTPEELKVGQTVTASGTANQDGSITAQSIQLRPEMPSAPAN